MASEEKSNKQKRADHLRRLFRKKSMWDVDKMSNGEVIRNFGKLEQK